MSRTQEKINNQNQNVYAGIDVGKDKLDFYIHPLNIRLQVDNDKKGINKLIRMSVRDRHEQRLALIEERETQGIETLLQRSSRENQLTGQSKDAFARASERRSGQERRSRDQQTHNPIHQQQQ